jgi:hypothetical protein
MEGEGDKTGPKKEVAKDVASPRNVIFPLMGGGLNP